MKKSLTGILLLLLLLACGNTANAQTYSGKQKFDGILRNEINGNLIGRYNVVTGVIRGNAVCLQVRRKKWQMSNPPRLFLTALNRVGGKQK